jgi:LysM repeat protein
MNKRSSASARIAAASALLVAFVLAVAVIGGALGGGDSSHSGKHGHGARAEHRSHQKRHTPATYVVQSGDTLVSISHRTGVPVVEIEALNPQVDPQILIAGEELKLK